MGLQLQVQLSALRELSPLKNCDFTLFNILGFVTTVFHRFIDLRDRRTC